MAALRSVLLNPPPLEGTGSYTFPDGSYYEGAWQNFLPHGEGTYTWPDGTVYRGCLSAGKCDGAGVLSVQNNGGLPFSECGAACTLTYAGGFSGGRANGEGTVTFPLVEIRTNPADVPTSFKGTFTDSAAAGAGTFQFPTTTEAGKWSKGAFVTGSSVRDPVATSAPPKPAAGQAPHQSTAEALSPDRESGYAYDDFQESGSALANGVSEMSPPSMGSIAQRRSLRAGAIEPHYSIGEQADAPLDRDEEEADLEDRVPADEV
jgi:hypothetical protein